MLNATCEWKMWTGEDPTSCMTDSISALYVSLNFICQMRMHIIFVLSFSYSLPFLFFFLLPIHKSDLPYPWIFHLEISH